MVAFSFQRRFVAPILAGTKRHTIRAIGKRRVWPDEGATLQLYTAMRTKSCELICERICRGWSEIGLVFDDDEDGEGVISPGLGIGQWGYTSLDEFAIGDGFASWADLKAFWRHVHQVRDEFEGRIVFWQPELRSQLTDAEAKLAEVAQGLAKRR